jgi:lysine 2,3-aminomutase
MSRSSIPLKVNLKVKDAAVLTAPKRLRNLEDLEGAGLLPAGTSSQDDYKEVAQAYDIAVTDHVAQIIDDPHGPIGRQYIPSPEELKITPEERADPIGDNAHSPVKGIVHRYPDRVLLKITNICAVYCRYCFRREMIGAGSDSGLAQAELDAALDYIEAHPQIWEVILTGGDPLVLSARRLKSLLDRLSAIDHVKVIRIHSRVPIASPNSVNETMLSVLKSVGKPIYLVLHINHPQEITDKIKKTVDNLRKTGCTLLSQSVLLKGVNDDAYTLETLFRALVSLHIKPYYLHHPDLASGTSHFRMSLAQGQEIMKELQGRLSGLCIPTYVLDIPGGYGKIPVSYNYIRAEDEGVYTLEDYQGGIHSYASGQTS